MAQTFDIGIDEVGRGCWAGPLLVVAARQRATLPVGVMDSKKLSKKQRESLLESITASCELGEGWVTPAEIDDLGLTEAMRLGVERALQALKATTAEHIVMDGHINYCPASFKQVTTMVKADDTVPLVSCASIYAKVTRDRYMSTLDSTYDQYRFAEHVGYGTAAHRAALEVYGVTDLHRRSYKPVQRYV